MATPTKGDKTEAPAEATEKAPRKAPALGLKVVDEIPPAPPSGASREFHNLLVQVANEHKGKAVEIATYQSKEGASQVRRAFNNGKRTPPGGNMEHWTMEARRNADGTSTLYVKYAEDGPDVPTDGPVTAGGDEDEDAES
jgi:hypothetical protein